MKVVIDKQWTGLPKMELGTESYVLRLNENFITDVLDRSFPLFYHPPGSCHKKNPLSIFFDLKSSSDSGEFASRSVNASYLGV